MLFLCSRWGKSLAEIEALPYSEIMLHKEFWDSFRWGMTDDLVAIALTTYLQSKSSKIKVDPWQVKNWTVQKGYAYRIKELIIKPTAVLRSGFLAIVDAIKGGSNGK